MALTAVEIRTRVRSLLNELVAGFFTDAEIDEWIEDAALDISTVARCVEATTTVSLIFNDRDYALPVDSVQVLHVARQATGIGLAKITPSIAGHTSATTTDVAPLRWFEWNQLLYVEPIPDAAAAGLVLDVFYAAATINVADLPDADQLLAVTYAAYRGKLKDEKFAQAALLFADYTNSLAFRRGDIYQRLPQREADLKVFLAGVAGG